MGTSSYETIESRSYLNIKYFFISKGKHQLIKVIDYSYIADLHERKVFNLGFGDYDIDTERTDDLINSANGDAYLVLNTVLNSIPKFFETYTDAVLIVQGSDSGNKFVESCKLTCRKKCENICKNQNRRISIYRKYVDSQLDNLSKTYTFYGGFKNEDDTLEIELYEVEKKYDSVLVTKKNHKFDK